MKFQYVSDLHHEFWNPNKVQKMSSQVLPETDADVILLAGDITTQKKMKNFIDNTNFYGKPVVMVGGNHFYYGGDILDHELPPNNKIDQWSLNDGFSLFGVNSDNPVAVISAELWASFRGGNPMDMLDAANGMNDFRRITNNGNKFTPTDMYELYKRDRDTIIRRLELCKKDGVNKVVVMTHYLPSFQCVNEKYRDSNLNGAYVGEMDDVIREYRPSVWVHGHSHDPVDIMIGETRVVSNPFGYHGYENTSSFVPGKCFTI